MGDFNPFFPQPQLTPQQTFARNAPYLNQINMRPYNTPLSPMDEMMFQGWLGKNNVPFDPKAPVSDYDMRGFWKGLQEGHPQAQSAIDPNDGKMHYPDYWKTPYHDTFSDQSQWAGPTAPKWNDQDQLVTPGARIQFDDRSR
jgi:hypothetical protein